MTIQNYSNIYWNIPALVGEELLLIWRSWQAMGAENRRVTFHWVFEN